MKPNSKQELKIELMPDNRCLIEITSKENNSILSSIQMNNITKSNNFGYYTEKTAYSSKLSDKNILKIKKRSNSKQIFMDIKVNKTLQPNYKNKKIFNHKQLPHITLKDYEEITAPFDSVYKSRNYTSLGEWNTSGTLSSKAYKSGINTLDNGVELCWGISNYGNNTYKVTYNISNFVSELTDSQMIYWTLIPYDFSN